MNRIAITAAMISAAASGSAFAEERIELNVTYPMNQEMFRLSDSIYFFQDNRGYFEVVEGPLEEGPARCIGGGFGQRDGSSSIQGICIFGEGDDTFTLRWDAGQAGAANAWSIVAGTGRFVGATGEGIATTGVEIMYRAMPLRQTHIIGTIEVAAD